MCPDRLTSVFGIYSAIQHGFKDYKAAPAWPRPAVTGPIFAPFFNGVASESSQLSNDTVASEALPVLILVLQC